MTDERKYEITAGLLKKIRGWESKYGYSTSMPEAAKWHTMDQYIVYDTNASIQNSVMIQVKGKITELRAWEDVSFMQELVQDMLALPGLSDKLIFRVQFQNRVWWIELFHYLPRSFNEPSKITRHGHRIWGANFPFAIWSLLASYYELLTIEETAAAVIDRVEAEMFTGALRVTRLADEMKAKTQQQDKKQQIRNELLMSKMTQLKQLEKEIAELRCNAT